MAFTRAWTIRPAGTIPAKQLDDEIRYTREDIQERMEAALFDDWELDPLVLKDEVAGKVTGKQLVIAGIEFVEESAKSHTYIANGSGITAFTDSFALHAAVHVPNGCTITKVEVLGDRVTSGSIQVILYRHAFATVMSATVVTTVAVGGAGAQLVASGVLAEVVGANFYYTLNVEAPGTAGNSFNLYGVRITYDTPNSTYTR